MRIPEKQLCVAVSQIPGRRYMPEETKGQATVGDWKSVGSEVNDFVMDNV